MSWSLGSMVTSFFEKLSPSRIMAKFAFLPPSPTYSFSDIEGENDGSAAKKRLELTGQVDERFLGGSVESVEPFMITTELKETIACTFVRHSEHPKYTILFSHGNAVDLGQTVPFVVDLASRLQCNVMTYDYSGYGRSSGTASEKTLYADIEAAWQCLREGYGLKPHEVVLYGQSLGTVPTVDLAARNEVAGVVLHSPLASAIRFAFPSVNRTHSWDWFKSIEKVPFISSLVLVIHGTNDRVINVANGRQIHENCKKTVPPLWVEGAGHNDIETSQEFYDRLKQFIDEELPRRSASL